MSSEVVIIDFHVHPKRRGKPVVDEILQVMDVEGVSKAVLLGRDTDPADLDDPMKRSKLMAGLLTAPERSIVDPRPITEVLGQLRGELSRSIRNEEVAGYVAAHSDRFVGLGSVNLGKSREYVASKLEEVTRFGLKGVKLHPQTQFFDPAESENFRFLCEAFEGTKRLIMVHTGTMPGIWEIPSLSEDANPSHLEPVAGEFNLPFVLAHAGAYSSLMPGIWLDEALSLGARHENVWFDISAVPYILTEPRMAEKIKAKVGFDRVLFGSDYLDYVGFTIEAVRGSPYLTEEEKLAVLGLNASRLLDEPT